MSQSRRITIAVTERQLRDLRHEAAERLLPLAELIRMRLGLTVPELNKVLEEARAEIESTTSGTDDD